jgi:hypothetical protein
VSGVVELVELEIFWALIGLEISELVARAVLIDAGGREMSAGSKGETVGGDPRSKVPMNVGMNARIPGWLALDS